MHNPDDILDSTMREAERIIDEMKKTKDLNQRKDQSEILNNLCQSAGVFFDFMSNTMMANGFPNMDKEDIFEGDD